MTATLNPGMPSPGTPTPRTRSRRDAAGLVILAGVVLLLVVGPWLAPYPPTQTDVGPSLQGPTWAHLFGVDAIGRDVFSRTLAGVRTSLGAASLAVAVAVSIGVPLGIVAGYLGGRTDAWLARAVGVLQSMPGLILAMAIVGATGRGLTNAMVAIGFVFVPRFFRVVRSAALSATAETYVEAARSMGAPGWRIMVGHVLPATASAALVQATVTMAVGILSEASLSYVGLGVQPPTASLGTLLADADDYLGLADHLAILPGLVMVAVVLVVTALAARLRRVLDRAAAR